MKQYLSPNRKAYTIWYVVFTTKEVRWHPLQKHLKKPFYHCYCFRDIKPHIYVADPTLSHINSSIYAYDSAKDWAKDLVKDKNTTVVCYRSYLDFNNRINHIGNIWPSCVSVVKMFLGIKSYSYTPYALYKWLLNNGGQIVK